MANITIEARLKSRFFHYFFATVCVFVLGVVAVFFVQGKLAVDKSWGQLLPKLDKSLRLLSSARAEGMHDYVDEIAAVIKRENNLRSISFIKGLHACRSYSYSLGGYSICWEGVHSGVLVVSASKNVDYAGDVDSVKIVTHMTPIDGAILILLVAFCAIATIVGFLLGCLTLRAIRREIAIPLAELEHQLICTENVSYSGNIKELANLAKAISFCKEELLGHVTAETIRWVAHDLKHPILCIHKFFARFRAMTSDVQRTKYVEENIELLERKLLSVAEVIENLQDAGLQPKLKISMTTAEELCDALSRYFGAKLRLAKSSRKETPLLVDEVKLLRALRNLIVNAIDASGTKYHVYLETYRKSREYVFQITNLGSTFRRGPSRKFGGRGLGIPISTAIVEAHNGRISYDSGTWPSSNLNSAVDAVRGTSFVQCRISIPLEKRKINVQ